MVIGVAAVVVDGNRSTGTFDTVIGFDVVKIVKFAGGGDVTVCMTGSIFTHRGPLDAAPAYDCSFTQLVIFC